LGLKIGLSFDVVEIFSSVLDEYDGSGEVSIGLSNATENKGIEFFSPYEYVICRSNCQIL